MCLDDQILNTYLDGELTEPWKSQVEEHLSYCSSCRSRYQNLVNLSQTVKCCALTDEEMENNKSRVLSMIEKNYISKKKKASFFRKQFKLTVPQFVGVAAAFVVVFVGSWSIFGGNQDNSIPLPDVNTTIDINNITPVRSSDNSATNKSLENYSLDEILKNLDARGYDVDIRLKSIQPLSFDQISEEIKVLAKIKELGITVTSDGLAKKDDGTIMATGVKVNKELRQIVASDGTILFKDYMIDFMDGQTATN